MSTAEHASTRSSKRAYLASEILSEGYDASEFTVFCEARKGSDIDMWTFEELISCVEEFKATHSVRKPRSGSPPRSPPQSQTLQRSATEEPQSNSDLRDSARDTTYSLAAKRIAVTPLHSEPKLQASVVRLELVQGGFFSRTYLLYEILTVPFKWSVKRRQSDFEWLRLTLSQTFPGYYVPPLPTEPSADEMLPELVKKHMSRLTLFLDAVMATPIFRASPVLHTYLKDADLNDMRSSFSNPRKPEKVQDFLSLTGSVTCSLNPGRPLSSFLDDSEAANRRLQTSTSELLQRLSGLSSHLYEYASLLQHTGALQRSMHTGQQLAVLYTALSGVVQRWAEFEREMAQLAHEYLLSFFDMKSRETAAMRELWAEREKFLSAYEKAESRLQAKKEKMWVQRDVAKWGLADLNIDLQTLVTDFAAAKCRMLPSETQEVGKLQHLFAFFNAQAQSESERVMRHSTKVASTHFGALAGECDQRLLALSQEWRDFFSIAGSLPED